MQSLPSMTASSPVQSSVRLCDPFGAVAVNGRVKGIHRRAGLILHIVRSSCGGADSGSDVHDGVLLSAPVVHGVAERLLDAEQVVEKFRKRGAFDLPIVFHAEIRHALRIAEGKMHEIFRLIFPVHDPGLRFHPVADEIGNPENARVLALAEPQEGIPCL